MSKIHLFMEMCSNADGDDFVCDVVSGGEDLQLATLLGKVVEKNPSLLKPLLMGSFRAMYEVGAIQDQDLNYALEEIEDSNLEVAFELVELMNNG